MNKITSKNDTFLRVHEDPVLAILQEQKKVKNLFTLYIYTEFDIK